MIDRNELATLATGIGAELGVAAGLYSETLLRVGRLDLLYSIDRWTDHHDEAEMRKAAERLAPFGNRSRIVCATFSDALAQFPDDTLDFLYIDGYAHTGQESGQTLREWWPKLKRGGIFAGHDYDPQYQPTIDAVDRFAAEHGLTISLTEESTLPSWYVVKP